MVDKDGKIGINFLIKSKVYMTNYLKKASNWKSILLLFIILGGFNFFAFPRYEAKINEVAEVDFKLLDVRLNYTYEDVVEAFDKIGAEGRSIYAFIVVKIDMVYPIIYGLFLILLFFALIQIVFSQNSKLIYLSLIPVIGVIFDYLENFNTLKLLNNYPNITFQQVKYGSHMTQLKWIFLSLTIGLIIILSIVWLYKRISVKINLIKIIIQKPFGKV